MRLSALLDAVRSSVRPLVPKQAYTVVSSLTNWGSVVKTVGIAQTLKVWRARGDTPVQISSSNLRHPFFLRPNTSDTSEFIYTICREAYGQYLPNDGVEYIFDAGANIGDTAAWFLSRYPSSQLIAVEPDSENYEVMRRNVAPYGPRVHLEQAAVWPVHSELNFGTNRQKDALQVMEFTGGTVRGIPVSDLLAKHGFPRIDIFKCDIEAAEKELFSVNADQWLSQTKFIVVEVHNSDCASAVHQACRRHGFSQRSFRNLQIFAR